MNIKVIDPQKIIWSAETRQIKIEYKGQSLLIRQYEDDKGGEFLVFLENKWTESHKISDPDLRKMVDTVCANIREDVFDQAGDVDLSEFF
jgi:hypothetical protein